MIRVIGGQWRGRTIPVMNHHSLRPTPNRVRETLFNWIGPNLAGLRCLDLFAGSGALGLEAASRGASHVTFVEVESRLCHQLRKVLTQFTQCTQWAPKRSSITQGTESAGHADALQLEVHRMDAADYVVTTHKTFDVVFLDPPFGQGWHERLAPHMFKITMPESVLYVEAEKALELSSPWQCRKQKRAGSVWYHLFQREPLA